MGRELVVIGAGPGGLTAAFEAHRHGISSVILEADDQVGGISRTVERNGWRFDLGGHRFFTKVARVDDFWHEVLTEEDFMLRPRMSRILYNGRFYDYPLRAMNALRNLGLFEAIRCVGSYVLVRLRPPTDQSNFEGWVAARFGWRLYRIFFKTYTEKVWGVPATEIQADWAAQRIKNLSLAKAVIAALLPKGRNSTAVTSLIEQFKYPRLGPGMMWEECARQVVAAGSELHLNTRVTEIRRLSTGALKVSCSSGQVFQAEHVLSTMPINELARVLIPSAPAEIMAAADSLRHRDFLTVAVVVPEASSFPDNWIYIHDPKVRVGRIQNFGSWSPHMVKPGFTCLGLEYFVSEGDDLWESDDSVLAELAVNELRQLGLVSSASLSEAWVVRVPKAYPVYDADYARALNVLREFLSHEWPEIHPVGRNGMHRYNNQDHSMLTAMLTIDNIALGTCHDVWEVNVEDEYHEELGGSKSPRGTGRDAPMLPKA